MFINSFDNSSMLSILSQSFSESHDRKDLLSSKFSDKCKRQMFPEKL